MRIEITGLVAIVGMVRARLFDGSRGRRALVTVSVLVHVSRHVTLVRVMRSGLFGWLGCHDASFLGLRESELKTRDVLIK